MVWQQGQRLFISYQAKVSNVMDQGLLNIIIMTVGSVFGWILRMLWTASQELKADLAKLREELPKDYIAKDDYRQDVKELKDMISKLFDILEKRRST